MLSINLAHQSWIFCINHGQVINGFYPENYWFCSWFPNDNIFQLIWGKKFPIVPTCGLFSSTEIDPHINFMCLLSEVCHFAFVHLIKARSILESDASYKAPLNVASSNFHLLQKLKRKQNRKTNQKSASFNLLLSTAF